MKKLTMLICGALLTSMGCNRNPMDRLLGVDRHNNDSPPAAQPAPNAPGEFSLLISGNTFRPEDPIEFSLRNNTNHDVTLNLDTPIVLYDTHNQPKNLKFPKVSPTVLLKPNMTYQWTLKDGINKEEYATPGKYTLVFPDYHESTVFVID